MEGTMEAEATTVVVEVVATALVEVVATAQVVVVRMAGVVDTAKPS
jgi:hypothetical protein